MEAWKANAEKEEESFLKILHGRMENSSAHGLPNIHRSSRPATKLFWLLLFLTGIGVVIWQVVTLFQTYFAFNYTVSLEIKFNRSQSFPAITICNMNPVMKSKLEKADDSFRELFDKNFKPPQDPKDMMMDMAASQQGGGSMSGEMGSREGGEDGAPAGDDGAPAGDDGAPAGDDGAPTGDNGAPTGDNGAPAGDDGAPAGDDGAPAGDDGAPAGDDGAPTGDNGAPAGDDGAPAGDDGGSGDGGGGPEMGETAQQPESSTAAGTVTNGASEASGANGQPMGPGGQPASQGQPADSATTVATASRSTTRVFSRSSSVTASRGGSTVTAGARSGDSTTTPATPSPATRASSSSSSVTTSGEDSIEVGTQEEFTTESIDSTTEAIETWEDRQKGEDFFMKQSDDYLKQQRLVVKLANKTIDERKSMGHSLEDMLLECSWKGYPCSPANFTSIFDPQYGNCYIFNSGQDGTTLTTSRPGPSYGLSLQLFVQQDEYMEDLTDAAGFRVIIHHPSTMPFPSDDGIFVSPGLVTDIGVRVLEIQRLPDPYGSCKEDVYKDIDDNIYYQHYNISYSTQTCEQTCYQRAVIKNCRCSDPSYPSPMDHNDTFYPCDIDDETETACLKDMERKYSDGNLGCECDAACHEISYLPTISASIWPSDNYEQKLFEKMVISNEEMRKQVKGQNSASWTRSNMAKLEIYFDEFNYEYIQQSPAYTIPDLLSDIGGQLGLWLGLSVITIFEIFEGFWVVVSFFCSRHRKTRPEHTIPTSKTMGESPPPAYHTHFSDKKRGGTNLQENVFS